MPPPLPRAAIRQMFIVVPMMTGGGRGGVDGQSWWYLHPKCAWLQSNFFGTRGHRHPRQKAAPLWRILSIRRGRLGGVTLFPYYHIVGQPKINDFSNSQWRKKSAFSGLAAPILVLSLPVAGAHPCGLEPCKKKLHWIGRERSVDGVVVAQVRFAWG